MTRHEPALLYGPDGLAHGHLATSDWLVEEDYRLWEAWLLPERGGNAHWAKADADLLPSFLRLAEADDEAIARFAGRYGMLELCAHGTLPVHVPENGHLDDAPRLCQFMNCYDHGEIVVADNLEPIERWRTFEIPGVERAEDWRRLSREAATILELAALEAPTDRQEWDLYSLVHDWIEGADVRPAMQRFPAGPRRIVLTGGGGLLSGALALAMLYAVVGGGPGLRQCANCREWFGQTPRQRAAARVWCTKPECQRGKLASAARDHRRRLRALSSAA